MSRKRRNHSTAFKAKVALAAVRGDRSPPLDRDLHALLQRRTPTQLAWQKNIRRRIL